MSRIFRIIIFSLAISFTNFNAISQINTEQMIAIGRNALYFEDYILSIQYFNQAISAKPYLAEPYFFRGLAKFNLEDIQGTIDDTSEALKRNPFLTHAYELRANAYQWNGADSLALIDYAKVLEENPEDRGVLLNKALALENLKKYDQSNDTYNKLIRLYPGYDKAYIGKAKLSLEQKDTVSAIENVNKALEINKNSVNGYVIRADIAINSHRDYQKALDDMNEAIKLQPQNPGFYINRAFLRHNLDDYHGAMSDFDYAIQLDPYNYVGYYNRALLRAEVHDFNRAIDDLTQVLDLKGKDYRTLYNRAIVYADKGDYDEALRDIEEVITAYPSLAAGYFLRGDIKRRMGDRSAETDINKSIALAKQNVKRVNVKSDGNNHTNASTSTGGNESNNTNDGTFDDLLGDADTESQEVVAARFSNLLTIDHNDPLELEYSNSTIRGRIQNRDINVKLEPIFVASYYISTNDLKKESEYMKEVDKINNTRELRFQVQVTSHEPSINDADEINRHFQSIEYYNSYLSTHTPRAIDYFGRGMDFVSVRNYRQAIEDFSKAIELSPDFTLAYFMRSVALYKEHYTDVASTTDDKKTSGMINKALLDKSLKDLETVLELSPNTAIAYYNKGVIMAELNDMEYALESFDKAIEKKPDFGEAYYNRGYIYFKLGKKAQGLADIRKAGELGVVASYNLLKRMNK